MWPFNGDKLKDRDALEKYRRWLRRWLLSINWRYVMAGTIAVALFITIAWATAVTPWKVSQPGEEVLIAGEIGTVSSEIYDEVSNDLIPAQNNSSTGLSKSEPPGEAGNETTAWPVWQPEPGELALPVSGKITTPYGFNYSPLYGDYRFNTGIYLEVEQAENVHPCLPGQVVEIKKSEQNEFIILIEHGNGWSSKYEGLNQVAVLEGSSVTTRDRLGKVELAEAGKGKILFTLLKDEEPVDPAVYFNKY